MKQILLVISLHLVIAACTSIQPEATFTTVLPTDTPIRHNCMDGFLCLTFDGNSCIYEGPTEVTAGPAVLVFFNDSSELAAVNFLRHLEDKTIQDAIEHRGEEPSSTPHPPWSIELGTWEKVRSGESIRWEGDLKPGAHHMVCVSFKRGAYFGTGLIVEE